jgi:hypothetical protein
MTRRDRLAARRRRYRWTGVLVASVIVGAAGTVAAFAYTDSSTPEPLPEVLEGVARASGDTTTTSRADRGDDFAVRSLSHDDPLRLWIGGDSLAGALGPALGTRLGDTGIVEAHVDYKVSSGLEPTTRDWPEYAPDLLAEHDPEVVVFMIGTNDTVVVNSQDADGDGIEDWQPTYRAKVDAMMELLVGNDARRTVVWIGAPTLREDGRNEHAAALNRVMQEEAARHRPYVLYVDAHARFSDPDEPGEYTDRLEVDGEMVRVRVGDGVHLTPAGADYLAEPVFALLDGRFRLGAQSDPAQAIQYTLAQGGELGGRGGGTNPGGNTNRGGKTNRGGSSRSGSGGSSGSGSTGGSQSGSGGSSPPTAAVPPTTPATEPVPATEPEPPAETPPSSPSP